MLKFTTASTLGWASNPDSFVDASARRRPFGPRVGTAGVDSFVEWQLEALEEFEDELGGEVQMEDATPAPPQEGLSRTTPAVHLQLGARAGVASRGLDDSGGAPTTDRIRRRLEAAW